MKKYKLPVGALCVLLLAAGCILSGTFNISVPLSKLNVAFSNGVVKEVVDLDDDPTWEDHSDNIERIERWTFDAVLINGSPSGGDTIDIYVSSDSTHTTRAAVQGAKSSLPILLGYVTQNATDTITIDDANALLVTSDPTFGQVKSLVQTGLFTVYMTSTGTTLNAAVDTANIYITFTAGK